MKVSNVMAQILGSVKKCSPVFGSNCTRRNAPCVLLGFNDREDAIRCVVPAVAISSVGNVAVFSLATLETLRKIIEFMNAAALGLDKS